MVKRVFAVSAHPDDIEFFMAGTMILLGRAGYELHTMTIANGSCGTLRHTREEIIRIRRDESRAAAAFIGAIHHDSLVEDMAIFFEPSTLARLAAVMREVAPEILLTLSPVDYMEDHQNACRLAVTAAFARGMPNFPTDPPVHAVDQEVTVYHAQPHGNCDPLGQAVIPGIYVDIAGVLAQKRAMLAHHESQKAWLDESQGMDSYLDMMEALCRQVGNTSGRFTYAEGWRRRLHFGYCAADADPLTAALGALAWKAM
ncbi:MAG: PIG-L deacetylase family protein [Anaerolineae bacterium]